MVQPPFSGPTRFSFGTFASVKKVSQNGVVPLISRIGRVSTPGRLHVDQQEADALVLLGFGSVRTRQKHQSANCAPEVQIFWPLTRQWSPLSSARVCSDGEVGAGARLGEALAPAQLALHDRRDVALLLLLVAVFEQGRAEHADAHAADRVGRADRAPSPASTPRFGRREAAAAVFGRPGRRAPALLAHPLAPELVRRRRASRAGLRIDRRHRRRRAARPGSWPPSRRAPRRGTASRSAPKSAMSPTSRRGRRWPAAGRAGPGCAWR